MNAKQIAVHELDGRHIHMVPYGLVDYVAGLGAEFADMRPMAEPESVLPARWSAYRMAAALLSVYRSRIDFLGHSALDSGVPPTGSRDASIGNASI